LEECGALGTAEDARSGRSVKLDGVGSSRSPVRSDHVGISWIGEPDFGVRQGAADWVVSVEPDVGEQKCPRPSRAGSLIGGH
jgi:hypothetical protein